MNKLNKAVARSLVVSVACLGFPALPAHAELIPTERIASPSMQQAGRERIAMMLARQEVRAALEKNGVDAAELDARVAALSDEEAEELAARFDALPAGQGIFEALALIFVVLLLTDILGFTKVFSFTRPIK